MPHSLWKIWIHGIFGTKKRTKLIPDLYRTELHDKLKLELENHNCSVRIINGTEDHVHCLFLLSNDVTISQLFKNIKGNSSHWVNQSGFINTKFAWQVGYGAFSVSESNVKLVEQYIRNQKEHHRKMTFKEEYDRFMKLHGLLL